jgi:hypothetical protein
MYKGPGLEGRVAGHKIGSECIIVKSTDDENRGIMFAFSACGVAVGTTSALGEIIKMSALQGKPWISKVVERGEALGESPS